MLAQILLYSELGIGLSHHELMSQTSIKFFVNSKASFGHFATLSYSKLTAKMKTKENFSMISF